MVRHIQYPINFLLSKYNYYKLKQSCLYVETAHSKLLSYLVPTLRSLFYISLFRQEYMDQGHSTQLSTSPDCIYAEMYKYCNPIQLHILAFQFLLIFVVHKKSFICRRFSVSIIIALLKTGMFNMIITVPGLPSIRLIEQLQLGAYKVYRYYKFKGCRFHKVWSISLSNPYGLL